ncbi:S1-like domain-containing RNA-binding protein [Paenibacillus aurantius]|uniref:S1-like domain-containing RNA-binding protein n=1 Tax=Paenibacillus aurantius TaxID=2918900 RepID=A0AA96LI42_9BACL|nr:S1-like domain-containing RNA-binding protein [Paenibacillus aurantius]WNQ13413.1 S1-like domain-containing RNA-binding protein [Paenibacillus aurantius]
MTLQAGTTVTLKVTKETKPYGYFVTDGVREVLLHYTETTGPVQVGEDVEVFLYFDTEDRLAATMKKPLMELGQVGLLEVADIHHRFGTFLDMGLGRQLLLPFKEQPELKELRPQVGDKVYVTMAHDRQGRLMAKLAGEEELAPLTFHAPTSWLNQWVEARVYKPLQMGTFVICEGGILGFGVIGMIHASERTRMLRVGETVQVRVMKVREDGRVNLSLKPLKEVGRVEDADKLLAYLKERPNGAMPFSDQTPADIIMQRFGISKSAFKRAMGKLMKEGLIVQKENWTYLQTDKDSGPAAPAGASDNE